MHVSVNARTAISMSDANAGFSRAMVASPRTDSA
jgi:hypothetical protein